MKVQVINLQLIAALRQPSENIAVNSNHRFNMHSSASWALENVPKLMMKTNRLSA